jgi:hypothetical protein
MAIAITMNYNWLKESISYHRAIAYTYFCTAKIVESFDHICSGNIRRGISELLGY